MVVVGDNLGLANQLLIEWQFLAIVGAKAIGKFNVHSIITLSADQRLTLYYPRHAAVFDVWIIAEAQVDLLARFDFAGAV